MSAAVLFCLVSAVPAVASDIEQLRRPAGYVHEAFSFEDGLPVAGISQVLQTADGYLWLATFDGLVRFDGVRFDTFDGERVPVLGSNRIIRLFEGPDGGLWILSEQGYLSRYRDGSFFACGQPVAGRARCDLSTQGPPSYSTMVAGHSGELWVGTDSELYRVAGDRLDSYPAPGLHGRVESVARGRAGRVWIGSTQGVWGCHEGQCREVSLPPGALSPKLPPQLERDRDGEVWLASSLGAGRIAEDGRHEVEVPGVEFVATDRLGQVWLGGGDRLLRKADGEVEVIAESSSGYAGLRTGNRSVLVGPNGESWVAWRDLLLLDGQVVHRFEESLAPGMSIALDRDGSLWISTGASGSLHALHPARVTTVAEGLGADSIVYPVYEDRGGAIWAGGRDFIARLDPLAPASRLSFERIELPLSEIQHAFALLRDRAGTFWLGTTRGLLIHDGDGFHGVPGTLVPGDASVRALYEDSGGALWVGTNDGLYRKRSAADGGGWQEIALPGLTSRWVRAILETLDGSLWLGTNGGGVARYRDGRLTTVTRADGLSSDLVRALYQAPDGHLWIATENRGLNRLDPTALERQDGLEIAQVSERHGLYSAGIHRMVPDDFGNLWMSSNQGIFRVALADLGRVADGELDRLDSVAYTEPDGMHNREANGGVQQAGLRDRRGAIWFPTQRGVVRIDPRHVLRDRQQPMFHVEGVAAGGLDISPQGGVITLTPERRSFSVAFSAPSFRSPDRQRFRYRLVPYEEKWNEVEGRRQAFYTKVPPGHYRFELLARSADGVWGERPSAVAILVQPRFYETGWFLAACFLLAGAVLASLLRWRSAQQRIRRRRLEELVEQRTATIAEQAARLEELDEMKSQFFTNVSHELRTPLTLLLGPLADVRTGQLGMVSDEAAEQLEVAEVNARRMLSLVEQLLDVARLDAGRLQLRCGRGDLAQLLERRVEAFQSLATRRGIELALSLPESPVEVYFDAQQFEKVVDNLLSNALKFTPPGGRVEVSLAAQESGRVAFRVQDDGPGFAPEEQETIFERFYRGRAQTVRNEPGSGIGLSLARQLVEMHGGEITATNSQEGGALFTVTLLIGRRHLPPERLAGPHTGTDGAFRTGLAAPLPLPVSTPLSDHDADGTVVPAADADRPTVLVVDDNPEIRSYLRRHLDREYRVEEAADGEQGLERAKRLSPDLVVTDLMMPGIDGHRLVEELRRLPELEMVPVVMLTARAGQRSRLEGLRQGVDDYLVKPFDPQELKARVGNLIASRRRLRDAYIAGSRPPILKVSEIAATPADKAFLERVQRTIEARLGDPELTVEALSDAVGCDRSYLLRRLRALLDETPSGLIRSLRLQRAAQLLEADAGAINEIAYAVGFKSVAHFSNSFLDRYGERPSKYAARRPVASE